MEVYPIGGMVRPMWSKTVVVLATWVGLGCGVTLAHAQGRPGDSKLKDRKEDIFDSMGGIKDQAALGALRFSLRFYDATTGGPIAGGEVSFEEQSAMTDAAGRVSFTMPETTKPDEDRRVATFKKDGYITSPVEVRFVLKDLWFNRYSISPRLPPGKVRIVLDWDRRPADLDAHLVKQGGYHISYRDMVKFEDKAELDRDDRNGYGPETITIDRLDPGATYRYFVHDYTNRRRPGAEGLSGSRAHAMVYSDGRLERQLWISEGRGRIWHAFDIRRGALEVVDRIVDEVP